MTLLKDLIDIPTTQAADDFVLKLTEGVSHIDATLRDYVVTSNLVPKFDAALGLIQEALGIQVERGQVKVVRAAASKAAYLHGSFGSGKSHFMAVLHALLSRNEKALSISELSSVVARHLPWIKERKCLLVPFHMLGAESLESRVLGGYAEHVRKFHPKAPTPAVFVSANIIASVERQRRAMGDVAFVKALNEHTGGKDDDWGDYGSEWTIERYESARAAPADDEEHRALVSTLLDTLAMEFRDVAMGSGGMFVRFDKGLEVISAHAKALGYDALVLLLDELILWLASHPGDHAFLEREISKLVNLVEAQAANRPVPIISFIARQRDLRQLVSATMPGVEQLAYADLLHFHEGRFMPIKLEDRDLPTIASKRLLVPLNEAAKRTIDDQFEKSKTTVQGVLDVLLTSERTVEDFRKVYPFTPALVEVLVDASSMLQRDRTALKAMRELLVRRRENLQLGEIVPLGDLFDVIAEGNEAIAETFKNSFERARRMWSDKLEPLLEREHGVSARDVRAGTADAVVSTRFRNDERLLKTLLLGTLVPNVPCLKSLNARRVAALNHGTIRSPIPGQESAVVLAKLRKWATEVPEIRLTGSDVDPVLAIELTGVDVQSILDNAADQDSEGSRARMIKQLVARDLGLEPAGGMYGEEFPWTWRGTSRSADLLFASVGNLPLSSLEYAGSVWKVVIDYPIDVDRSGPQADRNKIAEFRARGRPSSTIVWAPRWFHMGTVNDLSKLVRIEGILKGDNLRRYASHLPETERGTAKSLLEGQRVALEIRIRAVLLAAYGVSTQGQDGLDLTIQVPETFASLDESFTPRTPVGQTLKVCLESLLDQAMGHRYPEHPKFDTSIGRAVMRRMLGLCRAAVTTPQNRVNVEQPHRREAFGVVGPLQLGQMTGLDQPFVLGNTWKTHFLQKQAATRAEMTVANLRAWTDQPVPRGLPRDVQDLLILLFAEQTDRVFHQHGTAVPSVNIGELNDEMDLREQALPDPVTWDKAVDAANRVFGFGASPGRSASNVAELAKRTRELVQKHADESVELVKVLEPRIPPELVANASRLKTAKCMALWMGRLRTDDDLALVAQLAKPPIEGSVTAESLGASWQRAYEVTSALKRMNWDLLDGLRPIADERAQEARDVLGDVASALSQEEYVERLSTKLPDLERRATRIVIRVNPEPATVTLTPPAVNVSHLPPSESKGWKPVGDKRVEKLDRSGARREVDGLMTQLEMDPKLAVDLEWRLYRQE